MNKEKNKKEIRSRKKDAIKAVAPTLVFILIIALIAGLITWR